MYSSYKKCSLLLVAIGLAFLFWHFSQMQVTSVRFLDQRGAEHILSLSVKDKKRLFHFFWQLFVEDNFAYPLVSTKPIAWACFKNPFPFIDSFTFYDSLKNHNQTLRLGWRTWEKYKHLFPSVAFWAEASKRHPGITYVLIANKQNLNEVVVKNKKDFELVLGHEIIDGAQLFEEALNHSLIDDTLKAHQALLGIVLGYGRDNSWDFLKGIETHHFLSCVWDEDTKQRQIIRIREVATDLETLIRILSCPSFAGHPHTEESLALKKEYLLASERLASYYKNRDFLEATLSLLAGFQPP